jgi:hypothetical protein
MARGGDNTRAANPPLSTPKLTALRAFIPLILSHTLEHHD